MNTSDTKCRKCGQNAWEASERGAYLRRVNPKGESFIGECAPSCEHKHGGQDEALLGALEDTQPLLQQQTEGESG